MTKRAPNLRTRDKKPRIHLPPLIGHRSVELTAMLHLNVDWCFGN